jgi:hypothetical protein
MNREHQVRACVELLESEVSSKKGLSGLAIKNAYRTLKSLKPDATHKVIDHLYDDFWALYKQHQNEPGVLAQAWLGVIDQKAQSHSKTPLFGLYSVLKPSATRHIESALPKITVLFQQLDQT